VPPLLFAGAWILMALGYTYSGAAKLASPSWLDGTAVAHVLENPLARPGVLRQTILALPDGLLKLGTWATLAFELLFAPLALSRRGRPWIWTLGLAMHLGLIALINFADLSLGMVMLHLFTFDPAWVPPVNARATETLFYDAQCGLCHGAVRFLLAEDHTPGGAFRFAPLGGQTFRAAIPKAFDLADGLVLLTDDERILTRSRAALHVGQRLGGLWRVTAWFAGLLPTAALDRRYNAVARVRYRLFARPEGVCPIAARHLHSRLLA
jgi:predicted DCC family thiol-disulfide oxidoreductase YuxK